MSIAATVLFMMVSGGRDGGFLLKSTIISTVLRVFSSRLLRLQLLHFLSVSKSPSLMRQMTLVLSANFRSLTEGSFEVQSFV